jgi:hypothetical protein
MKRYTRFAKREINTLYRIVIREQVFNAKCDWSTSTVTYYPILNKNNDEKEWKSEILRRFSIGIENFDLPRITFFDEKPITIPKKI